MDELYSEDVVVDLDVLAGFLLEYPSHAPMTSTRRQDLAQRRAAAAERLSAPRRRRLAVISGTAPAA